MGEGELLVVASSSDSAAPPLKTDDLDWELAALERVESVMSTVSEADMHATLPSSLNYSTAASSTTTTTTTTSSSSPTASSGSASVLDSSSALHAHQSLAAYIMRHRRHGHLLCASAADYSVVRQLLLQNWVSPYRLRRDPDFRPTIKLRRRGTAARTTKFFTPYDSDFPTQPVSFRRDERTLQHMAQDCDSGSSFERFRAEFFRHYGMRLSQTLEGQQSLRLADVHEHVQDKFMASLRDHSDDACVALAFHGTKHANYPSIFARGLLVPRGVANGVHAANGSSYGTGVYTSRTVGYSLGYSSNGGVLVCGVIDTSVHRTAHHALPIESNGHCYANVSHDANTDDASKQRSKRAHIPRHLRKTSKSKAPKIVETTNVSLSVPVRGHHVSSFYDTSTDIHCHGNIMVSSDESLVIPLFVLQGDTLAEANSMRGKDQRLVPLHLMRQRQRARSIVKRNRVKHAVALSELYDW